MAHARRGPLATGRARRGYSAFISYSHALDGKLAPALQVGMERFGRRLFSGRALRIFRDNANLAASSDLWSAIIDAMKSSDWFILLASPEAATSVWVEREIDWWLDNRGSSHMLIGLTSGNFSWGEVNDPTTCALPHRLRFTKMPEPRWVDLRHLRSVENTDPVFQAAIAELAAPLHGVSKDDLVGEHVRQGKVRRRWIGSTITGLIFLTVVSVLAALTATEQQHRAEEQTSLANSRQLASAAVANLDLRVDVARLLAVEGYRLQPNPQTRRALLQTALASPHFTRSIASQSGVAAASASPTGDEFAVADHAEAIRIYDEVGRGVFTGVATPADTRVVAVDSAHRWLAAGNDNEIAIWDRTAGDHAPPVNSIPISLARPSEILVGAALDGDLLAVLIGRPDDSALGGVLIGDVRVYRINDQTLAARAYVEFDTIFPDALDPVRPHITFSNLGSRPALRVSSGSCKRVILDRFDLEILRTGDANCGLPANSFLEDSAPSAEGGGYFFDGSLTLNVGESPTRETTISTPFPFDDGEELALSPGLTRAAIIRNGVAHVADIDPAHSHEKAATRLAGASGVTDIVFLRGTRLLTVSSNFVELWDTAAIGPLAQRSGISIRDTYGYLEQPAVAMSPDSQHAAIADEDGDVFVIDLDSGSTRQVIRNAPDTSLSLAWSLNGSDLLIMQSNGSSCLWSLADGGSSAWTAPPEGESLQFHSASISASAEVRAVTAEGAVYAIAGRQSTVLAPAREESEVGPTAISTDGRYLARTNNDLIELLDLDHGGTILSAGSAKGLNTLQFAGAQLLLAGYPDGSVATYNTSQGIDHQIFSAGNGGISTLAGSSSVIASGGLGGEVTISASNSGELLARITLPTPDEPVFTGRSVAATSLGVTPDGATLLTAMSGGEALIWRLNNPQLMQVVCRSVGRDMTVEEWQSVTDADVPGDLHCER
jgi:WD40 repeat protein